MRRQKPAQQMEINNMTIHRRESAWELRLIHQKMAADAFTVTAGCPYSGWPWSPQGEQGHVPHTHVPARGRGLSLVTTGQFRCYSSTSQQILKLALWLGLMHKAWSPSEHSGEVAGSWEPSKGQMEPPRSKGILSKFLTVKISFAIFLLMKIVFHFVWVI